MVEDESDYASDDEADEAPEEEDDDYTLIVAAPVADWSRNPLPLKEKWINTV